MAREDAIEEEETGFKPPSLAVAALIVAAGFLGSRLLGLLRSVIIAQVYGTSPELDAYWVAFRLPDLVFQLLAGATLASAFIPTFAGGRTREGEAAAWRLASSVLNIVLIATVVFAVVAFLLAPVVVPWLAPGLGEETGRADELQSLAVELSRIMLISPILFAVSGMFMGILNARRHFLTPALAPMLYNLAIIVGALVSADIHTLAWAVVAGAALHLVVQLPDLRFAGMPYRFVADWKDRAVREVGALMAPRVIGLAATQISFYFVAIFFASRLDSGAISAISFAWLIVMTPLGVIGMSISTAAFPTLAEQAANEDGGLARTLSTALRMILYLSLPVGTGLMLLAQPVVVVLLQRGAFDVSSSQWTAEALIFYAPALFAHSGIEILSRGFYALSDTRTPVAIAVGAMVLNLVLAALFVGPLEIRGLALAISLATVCEFGALLFLLRRRIPGLIDAALLEAVWRMAVATAVMAACVGAVIALLTLILNLSVDLTIDAIVLLVLGGATGAAVYFATTLLLGSEEPRRLIARVPALQALLGSRL